MDGNCKDCDFWEPITGVPALAVNNGIERGRCRRYPPKATSVVMPQVNKITRQVTPQILESTARPITADVMGCGEFVPALVGAT
ncbi:MAG TPA: hypothetical protein ENI27_08545 [bacterium]|nr:hypothetical protein [bacterium]